MEKSIKKKPIIQIEKEQFIQQSIKRKEELLHSRKNNGAHEEKAEVLIIDYRRSGMGLSAEKGKEKENQFSLANTSRTVVRNSSEEAFCSKCGEKCVDNKTKNFKCGHLIHNVNLFIKSL